jgi:hypothetical protein
MNGHKTCFVAILLLSLYIVVPLSNAEDLLIHNIVTSPDNKTIWKTGSGYPDQAKVTVSLKNQLELPRQAVDVVLAIDGSGSLEKKGEESTDPEKLRIAAAQEFVDNSLDGEIGDRAGVVHWNDSIVGTPLDMSSDFVKVKRSINLSDSNGGTNLELALNASWNLLKNANPANLDSRKVIIVFTDGIDTESTPAAIKKVADDIKASNIEIYPLSLGSSDDNILRILGTPIYAESASDLSQKFNEISNKIFASVDNVEVKYLVPEELQFSGESDLVDKPSSRNGNTMTWKIGSLSPGESRQLTFNLASMLTGTYDLAETPVSKVTYKRVDRDSISTAAIPIDIVKVIEPAEFYYTGTGEGDTVYGDIYQDKKVTITKDIVAPSPGDLGCQNVLICVRTPAIDYDVVTVFALDSSGSMMQENYAAPMLQGVGDALTLSHPNMKYARVDWDDNSSANVNRTTGLSPNPLDSSIDYSSPYFRPGSLWPNEIRFLSRVPGWNGLPIFSDEEETTAYRSGLKEALHRIVTEKTGPTYRHPFLQLTTAWQVIFIAGKSEFMNESITDLVNGNHPDSALKNGINISTIGIDIGPTHGHTTKETKALKTMVNGTYGNPLVDLNLDTHNDPAEIEDKINDILANQVRNLSSKPVLKNVTVTETLYKYLKVLGSDPMYYRRTNNLDGTTTLYFRLPDMLQDDFRCIKIYTEMNFDNLPVDVGLNKSNKNSMDFRALETTPTSEVAYDIDLIPEKEDKVLLPEGKLSIRCGKPCDPCVELEPKADINTSKTTAGEDERSSTPPAPGFESFLAAMGLCVARYLSRRMN